MTDTILARPFHKVNAVHQDPHTAVKEVFYGRHDEFHNMLKQGHLNRFGLSTFIQEFQLFKDLFDRIGDTKNSEWATRLMLEAQEARNDMEERLAA
jgi:hypothetical protein